MRTLASLAFASVGSTRPQQYWLVLLTWRRRQCPRQHQWRMRVRLPQREHREREQRLRQRRRQRLDNYTTSSRCRRLTAFRLHRRHLQLHLPRHHRRSRPHPNRNCLRILSHSRRHLLHAGSTRSPYQRLDFGACVRWRIL